MPAVTRRTATALRGSKASPVLAFFMRGWHSAACVRPLARWCALGLLAGCATVPGSPEAVPGLSGSGFTPRALPGQGEAVVQALHRAERVRPLRYRVIVVPGSGCAGMGAFADRYFAGLQHAQVLVLHKPGVSPQARTGGAASGAAALRGFRRSYEIMGSSGCQRPNDGRCRLTIWGVSGDSKPHHAVRTSATGSAPKSGRAR